MNRNFKNIVKCSRDLFGGKKDFYKFAVLKR